MQRNQQSMADGHDLLVKAGLHYDIAAYEGGPSGYSTSPKSAEQTDALERYGKSLAMGVASLDAWLGSYAQGWTDQLYSAYTEGKWWTSHTFMSNGFRPHAAWLAMTLRNRYASGDMMAVTTDTAPTLAVQKDVLPLIGVYAMRDGARWSVFVLSRKLDGKHDGQDFGDGATPVTLHLPFATAKKVTLYTLTGDPRQSNIDKMNITIQTHDITATTLANGVFTINAESGGLVGGLPPGSVYLYTFEDTVK